MTSKKLASTAVAERHFRLHFPRFQSVTVQSLKVTNVLNLYLEEYRRQAFLTRITTFLFSFDSFPLFSTALPASHPLFLQTGQVAPQEILFQDDTFL